MPKVPDYELEHFSDDSDFRVTQKIHRKKKQVKEQKHLDKKSHRENWKKQQKARELLESNSDPDVEEEE